MATYSPEAQKIRDNYNQTIKDAKNQANNNPANRGSSNSNSNSNTTQTQSPSSQSPQQLVDNYVKNIQQQFDQGKITAQQGNNLINSYVGEVNNIVGLFNKPSGGQVQVSQGQGTYNLTNSTYTSPSGQGYSMLLGDVPAGTQLIGRNFNSGTSNLSQSLVNQNSNQSLSQYNQQVSQNWQAGQKSQNIQNNQPSSQQAQQVQAMVSQLANQQQIRNQIQAQQNSQGSNVEGIWNYLKATGKSLGRGTVLAVKGANEFVSGRYNREETQLIGQIKKELNISSKNPSYKDYIQIEKRLNQIESDPKQYAIYKAKAGLITSDNIDLEANKIAQQQADAKNLLLTTGMFVGAEALGAASTVPGYFGKVATATSYGLGSYLVGKQVYETAVNPSNENIGNLLITTGTIGAGYGASKLGDYLFGAKFMEAKISERDQPILRPHTENENVPTVKRVITPEGKEVEISMNKGDGISFDNKAGRAVVVTNRVRELLGLKPIYGGSPTGNFIEVNGELVKITKAEALKGYNKALDILQKKGFTESEARDFIRYNAEKPTATSSSINSLLVSSDEGLKIGVQETRIKAPREVQTQKVNPEGSIRDYLFKSRGGKPQITKVEAIGKPVGNLNEEEGIGSVNKYLFGANEEKVNYGREGGKTSKSAQFIETQKRFEITNQETGQKITTYAQRDATKLMNDVLVNSPRKGEVLKVGKNLLDEPTNPNDISELVFKIGKPKVIRGEQTVVTRTNPVRFIETVDYLNGKIIKEGLNAKGEVVLRTEEDIGMSVKKDNTGIRNKGTSKSTRPSNNINSLLIDNGEGQVAKQVSKTVSRPPQESNSIRAASDMVLKNIETAKAETRARVAEYKANRLNRLQAKYELAPSDMNSLLISKVPTNQRQQNRQQVRQNQNSISNVLFAQGVTQQTSQRQNTSQKTDLSLGLVSASLIGQRENLAQNNALTQKSNLAQTQDTALSQAISLKFGMPNPTPTRMNTPRPAPPPETPFTGLLFSGHHQSRIVKRKIVRRQGEGIGSLLTPTVTQQISNRRRVKPIRLSELTGFEIATV